MQILRYIIDQIPHASVLQFIGGELGGFLIFLYRFYFVEPPSVHRESRIDPIIYLPLDMLFGGVMGFVAGSFFLMNHSLVRQFAVAIVIGSAGIEVFAILHTKVLSFISRIHFT